MSMRSLSQGSGGMRVGGAGQVSSYTGCYLGTHTQMGEVIESVFVRLCVCVCEGAIELERQTERKSAREKKMENRGWSENINACLSAADISQSFRIDHMCSG